MDQMIICNVKDVAFNDGPTENRPLTSTQLYGAFLASFSSCFFFKFHSSLYCTLTALISLVSTVINVLV